MFKVGDIVKIKNDYINEIYQSYSKKITKKILKREFVINSINNIRVLDFSIKSIDNKIITAFGHEIYDVSRQIKLKKLLKCSN